MDPAEYAMMDVAEDQMWWYRALHVRLRDALTGVTGRVLDTGCGTGGFLKIIRALPRLECFGVEYAWEAADRARAKSDATIVQGSINLLPFASASFDAAIAADVLCHAAVEPTAALAELHRTLRPGGRLIINMPAYDWLMSAHDSRVHNARRQTVGQTKSMLLKAGFHHIRARYWNCLPLPLMVVQRKILARGGASSDVAPFPPWLDRILHGMTEVDRRLPIPPPFGGSVLAIAERP